MPFTRVRDKDDDALLLSGQRRTFLSIGTLGLGPNVKTSEAMLEFYFCDLATQFLHEFKIMHLRVH